MVKSIEYQAKRRAVIAQLVERIHGKDEVSGSNPDDGSILVLKNGLIFARIVEYRIRHLPP
jgi:hypothetical protein